MNDELADLKARYERLNSLYQVGHVIHSTLDPQEALQLIIEQAARLMRASSGSVVLINPTNGFLEIHAAEGLPSHASELRLRVGEGITGWVARTGRPARVGDVAKDPRYIMVRDMVRSELAVPLEVNGEIRGVLNVDSDRLDAFGEEDQQVLEALAEQAAKVIHHTWLYEQLRLKVRLFESLASVSQTINSTLNLDDALSVITREACVLMRAKMSSLMLLDDTRAWLDLRASHGAGQGYTNKPRLSVEESLLGIVVRRKKPLQVANVQISSRYQSIEVARLEGLTALLSVPLVYGGESIGALSVYTGQPYSFSNEEIRILSALAELSAIAIEKARLYERLVDVEEQLRQNEKLSALGLLAAEVAHEIRNPLTVMKMLYHSLDLKFPAGDPRTKDARIIGEKMEHLNKTVEQVLDLARSTEPEFTPVNLNELIKELSLLVRHKLKNQNVLLIRNLQPDLPQVMGEATQLEQAFLNLILNAAEAMPRGGTLTITSRVVKDSDSASDPDAAASEADEAAHGSGGPAISPPFRNPGAASTSGDEAASEELTPIAASAPSAAGCVTLEFKDTGQGMTAEQRQSAFTSVLRTTKIKGTGLGLAIVGRVVETHRGTIRIKSRTGHGTTIQINLPTSK
jgi:signal transduction histidine kinase